MQQNVVQLRKLLAERFPHLATSVHDLAPRAAATWPTGLPRLDDPLDGGLPKGALSELVVPPTHAGGALMTLALLRAAQANNQLAALIDGRDSFDPCALEQPLLNRLLWVRCHDAAQAMKAADLVLRDRNLPLVLLDLQINPETQLRKIPSSTWYRLQRIVEQTSTVCLALTPRPMVGGFQVRLTLRGRFSLSALEEDWETLISQLSFEVVDHRKASQWREKEATA